MTRPLLALPGGRLFLPMLVGLVLLGSGCGATTSDYVPTELKQRMPSLGELAVGVPGGPSGAEDSASRVVHGHIAELRDSLAPLSLLGDFFDDGASRDRAAAVFVALETPPHVADQVTRFRRDKAQLDVERVGDHAFFYLQYDRGDGFAPDDAMDASRMLVDGGTVLSGSYGQRPSLSQANGIHDPTVGYMRVHFNHRPGDEDAVNEAVHFDYNTQYKPRAASDEIFNFGHFAFFLRDDVTAEDGQLMAMVVGAKEDWGWVARSERRGSGVAFSWIAVFLADGSLGVWNNDGSLWACYNGKGSELGNAENPDACAHLKKPIAATPTSTGLWRSLPALQ